MAIVPYKMFASVFGDGAATIDVREDGMLRGVAWNFETDLDADGENAGFELSFAATNGFTSNDTTASIIGDGIRAGLLTSGALNASCRGYVSDLNIPVASGERLFLHTSASGPTACRLSVWLYLDVTGPGSRPAQRRR